MLVYAALHTPLSFEPAPALLTWVLFGAMMSSDRMIGERYILGRLVGINLAVFMLGSVPFALSLTKHGELLAERQLAARDHEHRLAQDDRNIGAVDADFWLSEGRSLRLAVEAAPESALVHSLSAVHFAAWEATEQIQEQARSAWARVLEIRPHQVSALIGLGLLVPTTSERRELWEHALDLDPTHPITLQNLARLETLEGDIERALEYIATLDDTGRTDASMLRDLGGRALLAGRTANGAALLSKVNPEFDLSRPDDLFALSQQAEQLGHNQLYSDALAAGAHRLWGIENLLAGDYAFGIAKFRQALRRTRRYLPEGDTPTRLALIAALELAERSDDAHAELENLESLAIEPAIWAELPEVARGALQRLGIQSAAAESEKESEDSE